MRQREEKAVSASRAEKSLGRYFAKYMIALAAFGGAALIYRVKSPAHDFFLGLLLGVFAYTAAITSARTFFRPSLRNLIRLHRQGFAYAGIFADPNLYVYLVPMSFLPFLLYQQGVPARYALFGAGAMIGLAGAYLLELRNSRDFYARLDPYIDWAALESVEGVDSPRA